MFFKTNDINIKILSSLELNWEKQNDSSDIRPYHALSLRVKGDATFKHQKGELSVKTGDIVFVPALYPYKLISGNEHLFVIHFTSDSVLPDTIKKISVQDIAYFKNKFYDFNFSWQKKEPGYEHECKSIFYKIVTNIERSYLGKKNFKYEDKIGAAVDYIHEKYTSENISVEHLAKLCNISSAYLRKMFHQRFSQSPQAYINKLKIQYATELLKSGYYSVYEVSDMCKFQNIHYFSSFIKKETGFTPSQIKKQAEPVPMSRVKFD